MIGYSTGYSWKESSTTSCASSLIYYDNSSYTTSSTCCDFYRSSGTTWNYPSTTTDQWVVLTSCKPSLKDQLKQIINERCSPSIIIKNNDRRKPLKISKDIREERARETLRRIIGDKKYFNFLKSGFISIKAKSGLVYQIFPGHGISCVFDQGKLIEKLCVVLKGEFPPTDSLIMRFLLITNNEQQFRSLAIKHQPYGQILEYGEKNVKSLVEIFKEIKVA